MSVFEAAVEAFARTDSDDEIGRENVAHGAHRSVEKIGEEIGGFQSEGNGEGEDKNIFDRSLSSGA